jgi:hypothetical protein
MNQSLKKRIEKIYIDNAVMKFSQEKYKSLKGSFSNPQEAFEHILQKNENNHNILDEIKEELGIVKLPEFTVNKEKGNINLMLLNLKKHHDLNFMDELKDFSKNSPQFQKI